MANDLGNYNIQQWATEGLIFLKAALGLSKTVYMGFDEEQRARGRGEIVNIRRPPSFVAQDAPSVAVDGISDMVAVTMNRWREVKFKLTDKELAYTGDSIIPDWLQPAAFAIAQDIDVSLGVTMQAGIGAHSAIDTTNYEKNSSKAHRALFDQSVPMDPASLYFAVSSAVQEGLHNSNFTQWNGAGPTGQPTLVSGALGFRYGMNHFATQSLASKVVGTLAGTPLLQGAAVKGQRSIILDAGSLTGILRAGDGVSFASDLTGTVYAVTAEATASANAIAITLEPPLQQALADNAPATVSIARTGVQNMAYHKNVAAIVTAPLSVMGNELGANIAYAVDPDSGLSLRTRLFYDGNASAVFAGVDALWGSVVLDGRLGVKISATS